jgi:hypothetical protein
VNGLLIPLVLHAVTLLTVLSNFTSGHIDRREELSTMFGGGTPGHPEQRIDEDAEATEDNPHARRLAFAHRHIIPEHSGARVNGTMRATNVSFPRGASDRL